MRKKELLFGIFCFVFLWESTYSQVNLNSGAAQVSIPLYSYNDAQDRLSTSVNLVYTAGNGLKVNEVPSSVGTGWELDYGGYVQRIKYGEPDDQKNYDNYTYPLLPNSDPLSAFWVWAKNYYPNGFLHSEFTSSDVVTNRGVYTPMYPSPYYYFKPPQTFLADREQDFFKFSFNGRVGFFLISRKNTSGISEIKTIYDSKLKIEMVEGDLNNTQNIRTTISKFIITDESGIKYVFEDADLDQVCDYDKGDVYNAANGAFLYQDNFINTNLYPNYNLRVIKGIPRNSFTKNKWNLTEIVNPLTGNKITFQYENYNVDIYTDKLIENSISQSTSRVSITKQHSVSQVKRLKKIILNFKESVDFEYSAGLRVDLPTDKSLSTILIKYENEAKFKWDFEYGYFVKTDIKSTSYNFNNEEKVWARLCLKSVRKSSSSGLAEPPYSFEYYRGNEDNKNSAVPPMFSVQQDLGGYYSTEFFGFYNPVNNTTNTTNPPYEPYNNVILPKAVYQNIIAGLNYNPLLGYGTGTSALRPTIEARNGVIKSVKNPLGGELSFDFENNKVGGAPYNNFYGVRVKKTTEYDGINHSNDIITEYAYIKEDNSSSGWGFENFENKELIVVRTRQDCSSGINPLLNAMSIAKPFGNYLLGQAGLIPVSSTMTNVGGTQVPNFVISYFANIIYSIIHSFFSGQPNPVYQTFNTDVHSSRLINNNILPFQYSRVETIKKLGNGTVGKTVNEFTSPVSTPSINSTSTFAIDVSSMSRPYSNKQRCAYWVYGLPEKITVYNKDNKKIKEVINIYNPVKYYLTGTQHLSMKWMPIQYEYSCGFVPPTEDLTATNKVVSETYSPLCGRIELANKKVYSYNSQNNISLVETEYGYSSSNYLPTWTKTINSKGEAMEQNLYYVSDYLLPGAIQTMKDNNMISVPISSQTLITKSGGQKYLLDGSVSEFGVITNGDIRPIRTYSFRSANPVLSTLVPFSSSQLLPNTTYYKETGSIVYDGNGMPVQINNDQGKVSTIFDNTSRLPVATVTNASVDDIAYTSFEGGDLGNWAYLSGSSLHTDKFITGKRSFSGTLIKGLINPGNYTVTAWSLGTGNIGVNNLPPGTPLLTIGEWKLYEWKLTNVNTVEISADRMDEVRLYPSNAQMSTIVYDPIIGKTAECDVSNRIIYYEYDELGRLRTVRDENRNVIKTYEYNFKQ